MEFSHHQTRSPPPKKAKTKFPKIFQCTGYGDCKMTFTRSEHLARHIRKHTGERPFRCHCNRTFSRLDNLRQHIQTVHANEHHILHAPPPPPLPHSNKVSGQHEYPTHQNSNGQQHQQQQYWQSGPPVQQTVVRNQNIIIEHNPSPTGTGHLQDTPPQFRPKHRPNPISLPEQYQNNGVSSPPGSPMNTSQGARTYSPSSPMFNNDNSNNNNNHQHWMRSQYPNGNAPYQYPTTPNGATPHGAAPNGPYGPGPHSNQHHQHHHHQGGPPPYPYYQQQSHSSPNMESHLHSYRSTISSTSSKHLSTSSSVTTPVSSTTKTSSWLSNVLCDQNEQEQEEDRPHTWGPNNNRYSSPGYEEQGDRNSLSQLVRITEDAHISTPPSTTPVESKHSSAGQNALPSLSTLFNNDGGNGSSTSLHRPPQLSSNRSYTKNLILPRPDSYPPKGYTLPMADTRPPALPPAGSDYQQKVSSPSSSGRMNKPLPPLPAEAVQQHQQHSNSESEATKDSSKAEGDGMDALIKAAGV